MHEMLADPLALELEPARRFRRVTECIEGNKIMAQGGSWDRVAGQWKQFQGDLKRKWGRLTDDELMQINGNRDVLAGKIQERYGIAKDEANRQIDDWANQLKF